MFVSTIICMSRPGVAMMMSGFDDKSENYATCFGVVHHIKTDLKRTWSSKLSPPINKHARKSVYRPNCRTNVAGMNNSENETINPTTNIPVCKANSRVGDKMTARTPIVVSCCYSACWEETSKNWNTTPTINRCNIGNKNAAVWEIQY